ncbi:hypothetical protein PUNSTDRAFT_63533 [Punctularia strigosozonata HHB-11173 SS5]|uniref:uncharacterized protein n=1 Tax=Punctularia strigosozonata (strain HHB-11173) TaxID=741275 RepID=UPI0004417662|nr:uncharacterized protein PUNSTDRAFT_63533 [Punctularia strigosozonata HHB-11173 SS5]EIN11787.1 hypothetical protein PUNSTDRAFT_63533 [Punctularia strigosozonata HHB-11173 SS5]
MIDLNPPYQRDIVWPEYKQINLITSIFENYYIPPIVFSVTKDEDGEPIRICVDGKQRLTSIRKFMDGAVHRYNKKSFWFSVPRSQKDNMLAVPQWAKDQFLKKTIQCAEYHDVAPTTEREIFQRVQMGTPLSAAAEKLQAISSPCAVWIGDLQEEFVNAEDGLTTVLNWNTKRAADYQCLVQLVYSCEHTWNRPTPTGKKLTTWLSRDNEPDNSFKAAIHQSLRELWAIAADPILNDAFSKVKRIVAPIEFVFMGVLLFVMRHKSRVDRAEAIHDMRIRVKEAHKDVRMNDDVARTLWDIIEEYLDIDDDERPVRRTRRKKSSRAEKDDDYAPSGRRH